MGHTRFSRLLIALLVSTVLSCSFVVPAFAKDKIDFESSGVVTFSRPNATTLQAGDSVTLEYRRINRSSINLSPSLYEWIFFHRNLQLVSTISSSYPSLKCDVSNDGSLNFESQELNSMKIAWCAEQLYTEVFLSPGSSVSITAVFNVIDTINTNDRLFYTMFPYSFGYSMPGDSQTRVYEDEFTDSQGNYDQQKWDDILGTIATGSSLNLAIAASKTNNIWTYFMPGSVPVSSGVAQSSGSKGSGSVPVSSGVAQSSGSKGSGSVPVSSSVTPAGEGLPLKSDANTDLDKVKAAGSLKAKLPKRVAVKDGHGLLMTELLNRYGVMLLVGSVLLVVMVLLVLNKYHRANGLFRLYRRALNIDAHNTKL